MRLQKRKKHKVSFCEHTLSLGKRTHIMGIINATPDSFSQDGLITSSKKNLQNEKNFSRKVINKAKKMIREGADIIDVGGESTRPGSPKISVKEEIARVIPCISSLAKQIQTPISIDSYKPEVIMRGLDAGASIVNDIMGSSPNKKILKMVRDYKAAIVLMHIKGTPRTMQKNISYKKDITEEILQTLKKSIEKCLEIGIKSDRIILDPGIGFGKTVEHNLEIINRLNRLNILKKPLLIGSSRKSFIGKILNKDVTDRLTGTIASVCVAVSHGAHIVRVHDVKKIKEAVTLTDAILNESY